MCLIQGSRFLHLVLIYNCYLATGIDSASIPDWMNDVEKRIITAINETETRLTQNIQDAETKIMKMINQTEERIIDNFNETESRVLNMVVRSNDIRNSSSGVFERWIKNIEERMEAIEKKLMDQEVCVEDSGSRLRTCFIHSPPEGCPYLYELPDHQQAHTFLQISNNSDITVSLWTRHRLTASHEIPFEVKQADPVKTWCRVDEDKEATCIILNTENSSGKSCLSNVICTYNDKISTICVRI